MFTLTGGHASFAMEDLHITLTPDPHNPRLALHNI